MSASNKARNAVERTRGRVKQAAGHQTGNPRLEAEGRTDRTTGNLKDAGEKVKDAFRR